MDQAFSVLTISNFCVMSTVLAYFSSFQTSHSYLVHDLGLPAWGSYLGFAFATVLSGLMLGLVSTLFLEY